MEFFAIVGGILAIILLFFIATGIWIGTENIEILTKAVKEQNNEE